MCGCLAVQGGSAHRGISGAPRWFSPIPAAAAIDARTSDGRVQHDVDLMFERFPSEQEEVPSPDVRVRRCSFPVWVPSTWPEVFGVPRYFLADFLGGLRHYIVRTGDEGSWSQGWPLGATSSAPTRSGLLPACHLLEASRKSRGARRSPRQWHGTLSSSRRAPSSTSRRSSVWPREQSTPRSCWTWRGPFIGSRATNERIVGQAGSAQSGRSRL